MKTIYQTTNLDFLFSKMNWLKMKTEKKPKKKNAKFTSRDKQEKYILYDKMGVGGGGSQ